ncbi:hypothetical protein NM208_g1854 [Fusarium decemcellulare]|uniref:Uncharacterized protein n=2 Tax=Fusarium decemcellulare TaxID=57161 RepID=A0ACC1SUU5_9HYPO|nr:hypothetical protein NM208_g7490 [Fusarium decemcellulare]KAJ3546750.1 hypothetical protein NM208_g1854 [Fusarium decemcellulare]
MSARSLGDVAWFSMHSFPTTGRLVIVDAEIAPTFLAAITLCISIIISLLLVRIPKALAISWCFITVTRQKRLAESLEQSRVVNGSGSWHLPVMLANCGLFLSDAVGSILSSFQHLRHAELFRGILFMALAVFCLISAILGPLFALLVSREATYGFAGPQRGPCIGQYNFSVTAKNYVQPGLNHHLRSYELLPWVPTFDYSWTQENTVYSTNETVEQSTSKVVYESLNGCLLEDDILCDSRFLRTHKVSVELSPSRMGLWYDESWNLKLNGYCLRLNSTSISWKTGSNFPSYVYGLNLAPDSRALNTGRARCSKDPQTSNAWYLGQGDYQRFDRRKSVITDSFFVNEDDDRGYPCYKWRNSLRALDADSMTVMTILPPHDRVNQVEDDELYLPAVANGQFNYAPHQVAHILCWEELYVQTSDGKSFKTSASWANRSALIKEHGLPTGLNPLLHFANTEFIVKPARFLRGSSSLLQSVAETPRREFNPANAPPVSFGAEVHRWAHIGAMDIASKATRAATGFYSRGTSDAVAMMDGDGGVSEELKDLCDAVRITKEGTVALPLHVLVALLVLLFVSLAWWALERIGVALAARGVSGPGGVVRAFLMLPAATPVSLAVSAETALLVAKGWGNNSDEQVVGSASGHPLVKAAGGNLGGPTLGYVREDQWVLSWGFSGFTAVNNDKMGEQLVADIERCLEYLAKGA